MKQTQGSADFGERLWRFVEQAMNVCVIGALWLLCSLPVFTAGAAFAGAYTVFLTFSQRGGKALFKPFFSGFKTCFKAVTPIWLITLVLLVLLVVDANYYFLKQTPLYAALGVLVLCLLAVVLAFSQYCFAIAAFFDCGFGQMVRLASSYIRASLLLALLCAATTVVVPAVLWVLGLWQLLMFAGGIVAFANCYLITRALQKPVGCFMPPTRLL